MQNQLLSIIIKMNRKIPINIQMNLPHWTFRKKITGVIFDQLLWKLHS